MLEELSANDLPNQQSTAEVMQRVSTASDLAEAVQGVIYVQECVREICWT